MKFLLLAMLSLLVISCASKREPSSISSESVEEGINAEYYGSPSLN